MHETSAAMKWIRHEQMLVDCFTKRAENNDRALNLQ